MSDTETEAEAEIFTRIPLRLISLDDGRQIYVSGGEPDVPILLHVFIGTNGILEEAPMRSPLRHRASGLMLLDTTIGHLYIPGSDQASRRPSWHTEATRERTEGDLVPDLDRYRFEETGSIVRIQHPASVGA